MQTTSCIKAISLFLRNTKKEISEDDLKNPISTFQTNYKFVR